MFGCYVEKLSSKSENPCIRTLDSILHRASLRIVGQITEAYCSDVPPTQLNTKIKPLKITISYGSSLFKDCDHVAVKTIFRLRIKKWRFSLSEICHASVNPSVDGLVTRGDCRSSTPWSWNMISLLYANLCCLYSFQASLLYVYNMLNIVTKLRNKTFFPKSGCKLIFWNIHVGTISIV